MPELPEVEVVRLFLEKKLTHKTISHLEILTPKSFIGDSNQIIDQKIVKFTRLGKQLSLHLQNQLIILFHLKMTGQIIFVPLSSKGKARREGDLKTILGHPTKDAFTNLPNKSTRLIFTFSDHSKLYFNDQRKFGWVKVLSPTELTDFQKNVGVDLLSPRFTLDYFYNQLQTSSRAIKLVLLDQSKFAGIGNIYANDALFLAKINPTTSSKNISLSQAKILHQKLVDLIKESISHGGSTAKDNKYIHPDGGFGEHQYHFRVYQRNGQPCLVCQTPIQRIKIGGRGTFFCPKCQK
jgi:formamidopyrimidine-DNA glycosylase